MRPGRRHWLESRMASSHSFLKAPGEGLALVTCRGPYPYVYIYIYVYLHIIYIYIHISCIYLHL